VLLEGIKSGADMPETFQKAYGKSLERVQKDLQSYVHATAFNASLFNTKLAKEVDAPEVSDSSPLEAGLVLADILANNRAKAAQARDLLGQLARDNPKDWQVEQGLARLSLLEGKPAEALTHYASAAELGGADAKLYLEYGRLLRGGGQRAEFEAILRHATEIEPDNREARLELGYAYESDDRQADALAQLQMVKSVAAEQSFAYFRTLAYAYYRLGRAPEAKAAVSTCRQYAKAPDEIARLDQLVQVMNDVPPTAWAASGGASEPPPPRLRRREALAVAEGTLKQIDCVDGKIRMRIAVGADSMAFAVLDPAAVSTKNGAPLDFVCGPQTPRRIRIEYQAKEDAMPGTVGVVRSIEFPE